MLWGMRVLLTGAVIMFGIAAMVATVRWIAVDRDPRWSRYYRSYDRHVDQRWLCAIPLGVDTLYASLGAGGNADGAYWVGLGVIVSIQVVLVSAVLLTVYLLNGRRPQR